MPDAPRPPKPVRPADLTLAAGMAALAGATDVYGLTRLHGIFVSFMSGNTTLLGTAIGGGDWSRAGLILGIVALFVAGAAAGSALDLLTGRAHPVAISAAVTLVLAIPLAIPGAAVPAFTVAMGALNASMNKVGDLSISLTYVTGTLVKFGQGLGRALCGRPDGGGWLWQTPIWFSLLAGAVVAVLLRNRVGDAAEWPLPAFSALLCAGMLWHGLATGALWRERV